MLAWRSTLEEQQLATGLTASLNPLATYRSALRSVASMALCIQFNFEGHLTCRHGDGNACPMLRGPPTA